MARLKVVDGDKQGVYLSGITDRDGWIYNITANDINRAIAERRNAPSFRASGRRNAVRVDGKCYDPKDIARVTVELKAGLQIGELRSRGLTVENTAKTYRELKFEYIRASNCN